MHEKLDKVELFNGDKWELPTDIKLVEIAANEFGSRVIEAGWDFEVATDVKLAFTEALINAIAHGNLGVIKTDNSDMSLQQLAFEKQEAQPSDKKVFVNLEIASDRISIMIKDEGRGFDWKNLKEPTETENLYKAQGRGVFFMKTFFDSVIYNVSGNEVTMIKNRK
jgi:anti-sigma regulatory factor (Ser/Thr protein kinase)